jgi:hypothetical protein
VAETENIFPRHRTHGYPHAPSVAGPIAQQQGTEGGAGAGDDRLCHVTRSICVCDGITGCPDSLALPAAVGQGILFARIVFRGARPLRSVARGRRLRRSPSAALSTWPAGPARGGLSPQPPRSQGPDHVARALPRAWGRWRVLLPARAVARGAAARLQSLPQPARGRDSEKAVP